MDGLDRLYYRLVHALRSRDPDGIDRSVSVADLYQHLVPFRAIRYELGFEDLADYERTLLRLLAGEREYVQLEGSHARAELRQELAAPHPILGIYRDYAATEFRLNPDLLPAAPPLDAAQEPEPLPLLEHTGESEPLPWLDELEDRDHSRCWTCRSALPSDVEVRFCPFCGVVQQQLPCTGCEAMLEPEWSFCVRCGLARQSQSS